jgi:hypothetical protein
MAKNIVACCDGTGNEFSESKSNVVKLYKMLVHDDSQIAYYHPGVGTSSHGVVSRRGGRHGRSRGLGREAILVKRPRRNIWNLLRWQHGRACGSDGSTRNPCGNATLYDNFDVLWAIQSGGVALRQIQEWSDTVAALDRDDVCGAQEDKGWNCWRDRLMTPGVRPVDADPHGRLSLVKTLCNRRMNELETDLT